MITGQTVKNTYQGDGVNREFTITFEFTDSSQIKFKVNGQEVTTNFALNTVAKTLTYPTVASELDPLTSADEIEIYRDTEITQAIEFNNGGPLNAKMIEDGLDKLTMIGQEIKAIAEGNPTGSVRTLDSGTNIDDVVVEGEYYIPNPSTDGNFPPDILSGQYAQGQPYSTSVFLIVKQFNSGSEYFKGVQIAYFFGVGVGSGHGVPYSIAIRTFDRSSGWKEISRLIQNFETGKYIPSGELYIPLYLYGGTTYFIPNKELSNDDALTSLELNHIEDSALPIIIYFKTGESFSGITAPDIIAWIGNTTLDTNSAYKITIVNLVATIEKMTIVE